MIRVVLDGLVKRFEGIAVVDGATLEVRPGELTILAGPGGSGKSTLARLVAGLELPDDGEVYFDGRAMRPVRPEDRKVGLVFQQDALWPHLSVADNVGYALRIKRIARPERRRRVVEALERLRIEGLADRRPEGLSPAQRQRVALARALVGDPDLLVLDEPLAPLDDPARGELREAIRQLHAEAEITMFMLTGDVREALALADRLAIIDLGRIVQVGPPAEIYHHPADAFVAQYLGPTNLIQGQLESTDARGEAVVRTPLGRLVGLAPLVPLAPGTPVTVAIRQESLSLGPTVPPNSNRFAATVERQVFLGDTRRIDLRGPGDWPVSALALSGPTNGLREGQALTVSVSPELVILLPSKFAAAT